MGTDSTEDTAVPAGARSEAQGQAEPDADSTSEVVVESGVPLSASMLWDLQRAFYDRHGTTAWSAGTVPFYVTCNPFVARAYARMILGFLRDCAGTAATQAWPVDPERPPYIVELGGGSGRFSFLLLRQLRAMMRTLVPGCGDGNRPLFRYVMTDLAEANLRAWDAHPALQSFVSEGLLDFARFDVERDRELTLLRSGTVLGPGTMPGPVIAIANYLFDTLAHDAWRIERGELLSGRATLVARQTGAEAPDLCDPALIERLALRMEYFPADDPPYGDPALDRILQGYRERLGDTSILLPIGAVRCLRALTELLDADGGQRGGRLLLLSADKGLSQEEDLLERNEPSLAHHGSVSVMVNFHALGAYTRDRGGLALTAPAWDGNLAVAAYVLEPNGGVSEDDFRETSLAFRDAAAGFGPYHFYTLLGSMLETCPTPPLEQILALLRLSEWDPAVVMRYSRAMMAAAPTASNRLRREMMQAFERIWANYFPIGELDDLPFEIGAIVQSIPRPAEAIGWYERSLELFGGHHATHTNVGLCLYQLGRLEEALAAFDRALECDSGHGPARDWRVRVQAELSGRSGPVRTPSAAWGRGRRAARRPAG